jgi:hypothetical protein
MKKILLLLVIATQNLLAQLPPVAQALYTEEYNADVTRGQYAITNSVQTLATADGNSFYLKWFPAGSTPSTTALLVTLHGTGSNAFNEFYLWHQKAAARGVGIIALQWYRGAASVSPNDYFDDPVIYSYIDTALKRIKYPSNKALLHGFSRGSARSYAIAFYDTRPVTGKNYFCTVMSNAGKADSTYPINAQINSGMYGHTIYSGKRWGMYCGGMDPNPARDGCVGMNSAKNWVTANGGTVGLYISDPALGHGGFHQTPAYIDSALKYYLPCFTGVSGIHENSLSNLFKIYPNPLKGLVHLEFLEKNNYKIEIINNFGQLLFESKYIAEDKITLALDKYNERIIVIKITDDVGRTYFKKCVIEN